MGVAIIFSLTVQFLYLVWRLLRSKDLLPALKLLPALGIVFEPPLDNPFPKGLGSGVVVPPFFPVFTDLYR